MKINPNFPYDVYTFIHKPIRELDQKIGNQFVERFLIGVQNEFESQQARVEKLPTLYNPAKIRPDLLQYLKDQVGFTRELNNITNNLNDNDLRKLISLAVALWKQKGIEPGYENIVRLFTGKTARIFNWFDFRMIVGENAFGEEQLGEDAWLISVPGVEGSSDPSNNVVALYTFEGNVKDRSLTGNDADIRGSVQFYTNPNAGFAITSKKHAALLGGVVEINNSNKYDLSSDLTLEFFFRSNLPENKQTIINKMDVDGKGFKIEIDKIANEIIYTISDGTTTLTDTLLSATNLDDYVNRHIALVLDRAGNGVRIYLNGTESTAKQPLGLLGDITNNAKMFIGGDAVGLNVIKGDIDNFRMCLNSVYDIDSATLAVPLSGFIEYQTELLDEFYTDIRIVDEGDLNKILIMRILNLMRPASERLSVIFTRFYDNFVDGVGQFDVTSGSIAVNVNGQMELVPSTNLSTAVLGDEEFQNMVLQVKANDILATGGEFGVTFFYQDSDNFYEFRIDLADRRTSVWKKVAGIFTMISGYVTEDIVPKASYIYTIVTDKSLYSSDSLLKCYVDSNLQHSVIDSSFEKGKFGLTTTNNTVLQVSEIEMFLRPLDVQVIGPNFDL